MKIKNDFPIATKADYGKNVKSTEQGLKGKDTVTISGDAGNIPISNITAMRIASVSKVNDVVTSLPPEKTAEAKSEAGMKNLAFALQSTTSAAAIASPAPAAPVLMEALKTLSDRNIEFFMKRSFRLPLVMDKYKKITPEEANTALAQLGENQESPLKAEMKGSSPITSLSRNDVSDLLAFTETDNTKTASSNPVLDFFKDAEAKGIKLKVRNSGSEGAFIAYRHIMDRGVQPEDRDKPVDLLRGETVVLTVNSGQAGKIPDLKAELAKSDEIFEKLNKNVSLFDTVMKPAGDIPTDKRIELGEGLIKYGTNRKYPHESLDYTAAYKYLQKKCPDKDGFLKTGELFTGLLKETFEKGWFPEYCTAIDFLANDNESGDPKVLTCLTKLLNEKVKFGDALNLLKTLPQPAKEGNMEKVTEIHLDDFRWGDGKTLEMLHQPIGDSTLQDRIDICYDIFKHAGGQYANSKPKNTKEMYEYIRNKTAESGDFVKLGKMYSEVMNTRSDREYQTDSNFRAVDFIQEQLMNNPDDFRVFTDLNKNKVTLDAAVKIHSFLPSPAKKGAYEKIADIILGRDSLTPANLEKMGAKPEDVSLSKRIDFMKRIQKKFQNGFGDGSWDTAAQHFEKLESIAKDEDDFLKIGEMYCRMLETGDQKVYNDASYLKGMDFINEYLIDKPVDFEAFLKIIKKGAPITNAIAIATYLPEPKKQGDYANVTEAFIEKGFQCVKTGYYGTGAIYLAIKPTFDLSLQDRIECIQKFYKPEGDNKDKQDWEKASSYYSYIKSIAQDGRDFIKLTDMVSNMLQSSRKEKWEDTAKDAITFVNNSLKDKPEAFNAFLEMLRRGASTAFAETLYTSLPQPPAKGAFEKTAGEFLRNGLFEIELIPAVLTPVFDSSLEERTAFLKTIFDSSLGNIMFSCYRPKNTLNNYNHILEKSHDKESFARNRKLFTGMLKAYGPGKWTEELNTAFDFALENLSENPADLESFIRILHNSKNPGSAVDGFKLIQEPVKNESYEIRERVISRLAARDSKINAAYDIVKNNTLPGETLDDTAALFSEILRKFCDSGAWGTEQAEQILKKAQTNKGQLNSNEILQLMVPFDRYDSVGYLRALNALKSGYDGESYKEREREFLTICSGENNSQSRENILKATELFEDRAVVATSLAPGESFTQGFERFKNLSDFMKKHLNSPREEVLDIFTQLGKTIQSGVFGKKTPDMIMTEFFSILTVRGKTEDSVDYLIHQQADAIEGKIVEGKDEISIGGVRLKKKTYRFLDIFKK